MSDKQRVAVTGGSGYIASWVVKKLLDHGHVVHATVRSTKDEDKISHLLKQGEIHPGRLHLFEADLLEGGFEEAFQGCDAVLHMASPFTIDKVKNPKTAFVDPAVEGTRRVMEAIEKTPTVKKVILTSSMVAVYNDAKEAQSLPNKMLTPDQWNTSATIDYQPYNYSKTEAEKLARKMCEGQDRWQLSTIHPAFVMGPSLSTRDDSASIGFIRDLLQGEMRLGAIDLSVGLVDVRDVAEAHIHALEREHAGGRYLCVNEVKNWLEICQLIQQVTENTEYPLPTKFLPNWVLYIFGPLRGLSWRYLRQNLGYSFHVDTSRTIDELGVRFRSLERTFRDMVLQLERDKII